MGAVKVIVISLRVRLSNCERGTREHGLLLVIAFGDMLESIHSKKPKCRTEPKEVSYCHGDAVCSVPGLVLQYGGSIIAAIFRLLLVCFSWAWVRLHVYIQVLQGC